MVFWIGFGGVFFAVFFFWSPVPTSDLRSRLILREVYKWYQGITGPSVLIMFWLWCFWSQQPGFRGTTQHSSNKRTRCWFLPESCKDDPVWFVQIHKFQFGGRWQGKQPRWNPKTTKAVSFNHCSRFFTCFLLVINDGNSFSDSVSNGSWHLRDQPKRLNSTPWKTYMTMQKTFKDVSPIKAALPNHFDPATKRRVWMCVFCRGLLGSPVPTFDLRLPWFLGWWFSI